MFRTSVLFQNQKVNLHLFSDSFSNTFKSVEEDIQIIVDKLSTIIIKLDTEILQLSAGEASTVSAAHQETRDPETSERSEDGNNQLMTPEHLKPDSNVEDGSDHNHTRLFSDIKQTSDFIFSNSDCNNVEETGKALDVKCQVHHKEDCISLENQRDLQEKAGVRMVNDKDKKETKSEWITVG